MPNFGAGNSSTIMSTEIFEGYIGIQFGNEQLIRDILFSIVFLLFVCFAFIFRSYLSLLFGKTITHFISIKERQNLFGSTIRENIVFKVFLKIQTLLLCAILFYLIYHTYHRIQDQTTFDTFIMLGVFLFILVIFYFFKQFLYFIYGQTLSENGKYRLWNTNYETLSYLWGISLYLPVLWLMFNDNSLQIVSLLFLFSYILYRISVIYITIRIFYDKNTGILYLSSYLCAQEIIPLLFLYEGLNYLQNVIEISTLWH